jgi:predicted transcriptional regulator
MPSKRKSGVGHTALRGRNSPPHSVSILFASVSNAAQHEGMSKAKEFEFEKPARVIDDEDKATLAAIDEGIRDAKAGRTVPMEKVRKLLPQWITGSSSRKEIKTNPGKSAR